MIGIQMLSARIGWVTGKGLAANINKQFPRWLTKSLVGLLVVANTINIAADIGAMGEALRLLVGGPLALYVLGFGLLCMATQVGFSYERSVRILKWLTLVLFSYVAVILTVHVPWRQAITESLHPWQFSLKDTSVKECAAEHLWRITEDTYIGMSFSNVVALCIVIATEVTLNEQGITDIQTSSQAAEALRPVAGEFAFLIFAPGIIGTGLLAVPVLAGSAAYAVIELYGWKASLSHGFREARGFYLIIIAATGIGTLMGYFEVDPIKALVWSAIVNGVISVPIMAAMMLVGQSEKLMGQYTISASHRFLGWGATLVMGVAVLVMFATSF